MASAGAAAGSSAAVKVWTISLARELTKRSSEEAKDRSTLDSASSTHSSEAGGDWGGGGRGACRPAATGIAGGGGLET